jgi:hypothetical protein
MGWALVSPGHRRRGIALATEARVAVEIVLGTAPWLVLAGLVEGFITPRGLGLGPVIVIGATLGAVYWALVLWRGRPTLLQARPRLGTEVGADAGVGQQVAVGLDHLGAGAP